MKLNGRSSLDPRWTNHHRPVARGFMRATVKIVRLSKDAEPVYDFATGTWTAPSTTVYTGAARIQPFGIMGDMVIGQDTTSRRLVNVQIDSRTVGADVDDTLYVTTAPADAPELAGYVFEIRGTMYSSNAWLTTLVCEVNMKDA